MSGEAWTLHLASSQDVEPSELEQLERRLRQLLEQQDARAAAEAEARAESVALYEHDFHAWVERQVALLNARRFGWLDLGNLIEEVDALARKDRREIQSRLAVILAHLLKWSHQPEQRTGSWRGSIREQRGQIALIIADSPSLAGHPAAVLAPAYETARASAADEMDRAESSLPPECPYTAAEVLDPGFLPEAIDAR